MRRFLGLMLLGLVSSISLGCEGKSPETTDTEATSPIADSNSTTPAPNLGEAVPQLKIEKDFVVAMDYKLTDPEGKVLDTSEGREPLYYLHGADNIIPGLEKALTGKVEGDKLTVTIQPEEAYGVRDDALVEKLPREDFKDIPELAVGMTLQAQTAQGVMVLKVVEVGEETVTIDRNHELAGVTLTFDVNIVKVREATPEELAHKHVHGPGGAQH